MNPLTNVRNVTKLSQRELEGFHGKTSWHDEYKDSAWIFVGGMPYDLTEGDVLTVFSQWGEIVNINMIRDKATGKFKGFGFICYENQKSTVLAVDNFNGIKVLGRTIRVDHVKDYKPPKDSDKLDDITRQLYEQGCAPEVQVPTSKIVGGYALVESDEDEYRDNGLGTHSVLKGIPDRPTNNFRPDDHRSRVPFLAEETDMNRRKQQTETVQSARMPEVEVDKDNIRERSSKKHSSKKNKKKHSKSKKEKNRRKHKRKDSRDSDSSSSSSSSSSDSESEDDNLKRISKRKKHRKEK